MAATPGVRILDQRTTQEHNRAFLPGMSTRWLLPLYDVGTRLTGVRRVYARTAALADIAPGHSLLDVGCGTGNLSLAVLADVPQAHVIGLDPDGAALRCAARKARRRRASLTLVQGYADRLPAEDASLDHVVSSLTLHHVDDDSQSAFASEALRALRPGGTITIADLGGHGHAHPDAGREGRSVQGAPGGHTGSSGGLAHLLSHLRQRPRLRVGQHPPTPHTSGHNLVALLAEGGFTDVGEVDRLDHRFGRITFIQARRP